MRSRDQLLALLLRHRGGYVSGGRAAEELHISRSAVWKAVESLRNDGYQIEAAPRKGYRLSKDNDILSPEGLADEIGPPVSRDQIRVFRELPSTNRTAKELAVGGAAHGTVVIADRQSSGSGHYARAFYSPEGGVYLSVILRPDHFQLRCPPLITLTAAAVTADAIEALCGVSPGIRWINDLFLDGRKICGILTESASDFESGELEWIVVGIGINLAVRTGEFPEEIRGCAGSIYEYGHAEVSRARLAGRIVRDLLSAGERKSEDLIDSYRRRLMMKNEIVRLRSAGKTEQVRLIDIDGCGRLIVERADGTRGSYTAGEIRPVKDGDGREIVKTEKAGDRDDGV